MNKLNHKYDWRPDRPDSRDYRYAIPPEHAAGNLPSRVDLRPKCPPAYDQGDLGACTGNALAGLFEFLQIDLGIPSWIPSRLFIYYGERVIEGDVGQDNGAALRDGMTVLEQKGVCPESLWPYDVSRFAVKPPSSAYGVAVHHKISLYERLVSTSVLPLKSCLASGFPFAFGFTAYESLESQEVANTGVLPMPAPHEQPIGGHAVMAVGYDDPSRVFIVRNSWGPAWGQAGYFTMPYTYLMNSDLASDFWTARKTV